MIFNDSFLTSIWHLNDQYDSRAVPELISSVVCES